MPYDLELWCGLNEGEGLTMPEVELSEDGKGGYLVEEDGKSHLPTTKNGKPDHGLMGAAWAALHGGYRGNKYEGPNKSSAISKLKALYKSEGMETPKALSEHITYAPNTAPHAHLFAYGLVTLGELIPTSPADHPLYRIPMAYTGTFVKGDDRFQITKADLTSIVKNFKKKGTGTVNVDYEHASENPEVAHGGPIPASGWISDVWLEEQDGEPVLMGAVEYTAAAKEHVDKKEYRFFSPAIDWAAKDKETGLPQGATLTSAALTNRPFLEKLPPLLMSEVPRILSDKEPPMANKMFRLKKAADGKVNVHMSGATDGEFGECMGEIYPADMACMSAGGTSSPGEPDLPKAMSVVLGEAQPVEMPTVKKFYEAGKKAIQATDAQAGHKLLASCVGADGLDKKKSRKLLADGQVSPQQYAAFENAVELVAEGIEAGKLHPSNYAYHLTEAIQRPDEFSKFLENAKPFVELGEHGISGTDSTGRTLHAGEGDKLKADIKAYRAANPKATYRQALVAVAGGDKERAARFREEGRTARTM